MTWTTEALDTTTRLWREGITASEISKALARDYRIRKSRSAVLGVLHRMKLCGPAAGRPTRRAKPLSPTAKRKRARFNAEPRFKERPMPKEAPPPVEPLHISILDIGFDQCRAITDNSEWGRARMCGQKCAPNSVYCHGHTVRYQPSVAR